MKFIGVPGSIVTTLTCAAFVTGLTSKRNDGVFLGKRREVAIATGTNPIGWSSAHED
jgi:hypothetical protein